jgi:hypothetical protein
MNGPDHYRRAEELMGRDIPEAHVHALLALAAAIAVKTQAEQEAWIWVAATMPPLGGGGPTPPRPGEITPAQPASQQTPY